MADNYLERRMEDYRAGKLGARKSPTATSSKAREGYLQIPFPPRRVFVTGGAGGIGRAIVLAFRKAGCPVSFCDKDEKRGRALAQEAGAEFHPVDVSDTDRLTAAVQHVLHHRGDIDILINNVGIADFRPLTDCSPADFMHTLSVNLTPAFVTSQLLAEHRKNLAEPNPFGGRIINICSTRHLMSEEGTEAYSASKGALRSLTHALMMSLAKYRITANSISPGWIECVDYSALADADHAQHPSQRVGRPEDVARACLFLAAPDSDFINGIDLVIDGGMTHKMIYQP